jgi:hypothetical protein
VVLPLDHAVAELGELRVELEAEAAAAALELGDLVRGPGGGGRRALDRQEPDADVGLAGGAVGEHALLRREAVPRRRLARRVDQHADGGGLHLAVVPGEDPLRGAARDDGGEHAGHHDGDEGDDDAGEELRAPLGREGIEEIIPPLHAATVPRAPGAVREGARARRADRHRAASRQKRRQSTASCSDQKSPRGTNPCASRRSRLARKRSPCGSCMRST